MAAPYPQKPKSMHAFVSVAHWMCKYLAVYYFMPSFPKKIKVTCDIGYMI